MPSWETERRKVWGLMLDLKGQVKSLKEEIKEMRNIKGPEQSAKQTEA